MQFSQAKRAEVSKLLLEADANTFGELHITIVTYVMAGRILPILRGVRTHEYETRVWLIGEGG